MKKIIGDEYPPQSQKANLLKLYRSGHSSRHKAQSSMISRAVNRWRKGRLCLVNAISMPGGFRRL